MEMVYSARNRMILVMRTLYELAALQLAERMQSLQATEGKNEHESNLLVLGKLQLLQQRHWKPKHDQIRRDIQRGIRESKGQLIHAMPIDGLIPEIRNGKTHEGRAEERPGAVDDEHADEDVGELADPVLRENAAVLQHDGNLGQHKRQVIDGDRGPEGLQNVSPRRIIWKTASHYLKEFPQLFYRNLLEWQTEAIFDFL